jgi:Tol biopolymer transport system component
MTLGPPGQQLAFAERSIYVIDTVSEGSQLLVSSGFFPSWSPDGSRIAYNCNTDSRPGKYKWSLCVVPVVSHPQPRVLAENAMTPVWSPNGENIAYISLAHKKGQLMICHADGSNVVSLTNGKRQVGSIVWSPDGKRIAFTEDHPIEDEVIRSGPRDVPRIFVVNMNGARIGPFGEKDHLWCRDLSWSSDGKYIAAICSRGLRDKKTGRQLFGNSLFVLDSTNLKSRPRVIAQNGVSRPVFSPR